MVRLVRSIPCRTALLAALLALFVSCAARGSAGNYGPVLVAPDVSFRLLPPRDIEKNIDHFQWISGVYGARQFAFNALVRADEKEIVMELFGDMGNSLGTLDYDGTKLLFDSSWLPKNIKAEYAVADIQFCYYRIEALRAALPGLRVETETVNGGETRRFYRGGTLIIEIEKSPRPGGGDRGSRLRYVNHLRNYSYTIEGALL